LNYPRPKGGGFKDQIKTLSKGVVTKFEMMNGLLNKENLWTNRRRINLSYLSLQICRPVTFISVYSSPGKLIYMRHPRHRGMAGSSGVSNFCSSFARATEAKKPVLLMAEHRFSISFRLSGIFAWSSG
jgi:hypothetical protein